MAEKKHIDRVIKICITRKEVCFNEPETKNLAHELVQTDDEIEEETIDSMTIFDSTDGSRSQLNDMDTMIRNLKKAGNHIP